jgi:molybdate transport system substrate-binding protein
MQSRESTASVPITRRHWLALAGLALAGAGSAARAQGGRRDAGAATGVAVASSVQAAMEELVPAFTQVSGHRLALSYGASGNLVRQIGQGLPVELFLSADEDFANALARAGWARDGGVVYATGRLALVVARGTSIALDPGLRGLKAGWAGVRRFAIANPLLAPYGNAAREALEQVGLWDAAQPKLVLGENVAQAAQFVGTGSAEAGLTALSLLVGRTDAPWRGHVAVDSALHAPLRQRMVLRRQAGPAASAFYDYLQTPAAQAVLQRHGFN